MARIDEICAEDICPNCDQLYGSQEEVGRLTMLCDEQQKEIERLRDECNLYSGIADERCEALYKADSEVERLIRQRDAVMAIEYAAREWAAGRLTDDGLREQLAASTTGGDDATTDNG